MRKRGKECCELRCSHYEAHKIAIVNMTDRSREIKSAAFGARALYRVYFWTSLRGELDGKR